MDAKIITLTGIDGCGKSLQFEKLSKWFKEKGWSYFSVRFSPRKRENYSIYHEMKYRLLGEGIVMPADIRSIILAFDTYVQICTELIPNIKKYDYIITDRYIESTLLYLKGREIDFYWPQQILKSVPKPDIYLYLQTDIDTSLKRIDKRAGGRQSHENYETLKKIKKCFDDSIDTYNFKCVDASDNEDVVFHKIINILFENNIITEIYHEK